MLSVQIYFTPKFESETEDHITYIKGLINTANAVYANSGVGIVMRVTCFTRLNGFTETGDALKMLQTFRNSKRMLTLVCGDSPN